jgi:hypothetical protein
MTTFITIIIIVSITIIILITIHIIILIITTHLVQCDSALGSRSHQQKHQLTGEVW